MFINFTFIKGQESENKLAFRLATYCSVFTLLLKIES